MTRRALRLLCSTLGSLLVAAGPAAAYELEEIPLTRWPQEGAPYQVGPEDVRERFAEGPLQLEHVDSLHPVAGSRAQEERGLVALLVDESLLADISDSLDVFMEDLALDGHSVLLESSSGGSAEELKAHLQELYEEDDLRGAILIGDLPIAWFEVKNDYGAYGYALFPCDLQLADLDGAWEDFDENGIADRHSEGEGDTPPEIWIGRMVITPQMGDPAELINSYFSRNHAYRRGEIVPTGEGLVYVDDDWSYWAAEYAAEIAGGFSEITMESEPNVTSKNDYIPRLSQAYDNVAVFVHSSPDQHYFVYQGVYDMMDWDEVPTESDALFYDLFACSNANFADYVYMAGTYAFQTRWGLLALGSTKTGSMLEREGYYRPLGRYEEFGEALRSWWEDVHPYDVQQRLNWYYGLIQVGDPTLRVGFATVDSSLEELAQDSYDDQPVEVTVELRNAGYDGFFWRADLDQADLDDLDWISLDKDEGEVDETVDSFTITLDPAQLAEGEQVLETLLLHAPGATNNPLSIPISLGRWASPELCVTPGALELEADAGELAVANCHAGPLSWAVATDASWLTLGSEGGSIEEGEQLLTLEADSRGMAQGSHQATLVFSSDQAVNSPTEVLVELQVGDEGLVQPRCGCASGARRVAGGALGWLLLGGLALLRRREPL